MDDKYPECSGLFKLQQSIIELQSEEEQSPLKRRMHERVKSMDQDLNSFVNQSKHDYLIFEDEP